MLKKKSKSVLLLSSILIGSVSVLTVEVNANNAPIITSNEGEFKKTLSANKDKKYLEIMIKDNNELKNIKVYKDNKLYYEDYSKKKSNKVRIELENNGTYKVVAINKNNKSTTKTIKITNFKNESPIASYTINAKKELVLTAYDVDGIKSIKYDNDTRDIKNSKRTIQYFSVKKGKTITITDATGKSTKIVVK